MDQAELVTILAEIIFVPPYALQHYIKWEVINELIIMGTITDGGINTSGTFYFNESFEITKLETNDRFFSSKEGNYEKTKWTVLVDNYVKKNGYRFPESIRAIWNRQNGDYEYFKGNI